jgi:hypothetical protein
MTKIIIRWLAALCALAVVLFACIARADAPTLTDRIATQLTALTRFSLDTETAAERAARMQETASYIADGVNRATCTGRYAVADCRRVWNGNKRDLAAAVISLGFYETRYAQAVSEGKCHTLPKGMRCDNGKALGFWQQWVAACPEAWAAERGSEAERRAGAWCAARLLANHYNYCRTLTGSIDPWIAAYSMYGGQGCKAWPGAEKRRLLLTKVLSKL